MSWKVHLQIKCATCWTIFSCVIKFANFVMGVVTTIHSIDLWIVEPTTLPMSFRGLNLFHHMVTNLYIRPTKPHLLMWTLMSSTYYMEIKFKNFKNYARPYSTIWDLWAWPFAQGINVHCFGPFILQCFYVLIIQ